MGFINKIKNILFEEEVVEEEEINKKSQVEKELNKPQKVDNSSNLFDLLEDEPRKVDPKKEIKTESFSADDLSDRDLYKSEKTFNFPVFDEEEFESTLPKPRTTNVMVNEKPIVRKTEKRAEYPHYEVPVKNEDKKKFKPSPIISPVYGILDKDYQKEDILPKRKEDDIERKYTGLNIDSVRKKAFGSLEDEIESTITTPREEFFKEVEEELKNDIPEPKHEKKNVEVEKIDDIIPEIEEEKIAESIEETEKFNIDDLLEEAAHEEIIVTEDEKDNNIDDIESELDKIEDEEESEEIETFDTEKREVSEDDTLEQDLFELIDSMYEDRKGTE